MTEQQASHFDVCLKFDGSNSSLIILLLSSFHSHELPEGMDSPRKQSTFNHQAWTQMLWTIFQWDRNTQAMMIQTHDGRLEPQSQVRDCGMW